MSWLVSPTRVSDAAVDLVIVPHAGSGAAPYVPLARSIAGVRPWVVRLPTRESRLREPSPARVQDLGAALAHEIARAGLGTVALFGHCSGAWVAFEAARAMVASGQSPLALLVSASPPPHQRSRFAAHGDLDAQIRELTRIGYTTSRVLEDPELAELYLPALRADVGMLRTYQLEPRAPLSCPIVAWYGASDSLVGRDVVAAWREHTTGSFALASWPGGHFSLLEDSGPERARDLSRVLIERVASHPQRPLR